MIENTNLVPKRRFKEFQNAATWEQRKLGDVTNYIVDNRGKNPSYYCSSGIPVIDNYMIKNNCYPNLEEANRFIDDNLYENFIRKYNEVDDVIITLVGNGIGNIALFPKQKSVIIQNTLGLRFKSNKKFKYYALQAKNREIVQLDRGMAQPSIRQDELLDIDLMIPSEEEQSKIERFFFKLDSLITLHQRKFEKMKSLKSAYLSEMFPAEGEQEPKRRFAGFTNAWEQQTFSDVLEYSVSNNTLSRAGLNYEEGDVKNIHYGDILVKFDTIVDVNSDDVPFITNGKPEDYKAQLLRNGDVIIADTAEDETTGKAIEVTGITDNYAVSGLHTMVARPNIEFAPTYLGYYLNSPAYHNQLLKLMQGIKVLSLSKANVAKTKVDFPKDVAEQAKIGELFTNLDNLITLHQRKLEKLQNIKKAYLNEMFI
ncbi:restriction endonuclease subunit S [Metaclostridioides mangenotii]|uniref:restriction endonuclease subunit S n=1 Tax=Metaclostridioides mangenotii TaxID=1540 RepID=UPI0028E3942E|nr:restriction endonuclease subunit S [Clostridioides mangenotii]